MSVIILVDHLIAENQWFFSYTSGMGLVDHLIAENQWFSM